MALPTSPSVVVLEKDNSIYTPNSDSSVVGVVGFADKGPVNEATLVTSQAQLLNTFGRPNSDIPGQGLEGALEILEATNQVYFVRAADTGALEATVKAELGGCPAVKILTYLGSDFLLEEVTVDSFSGGFIYYNVVGQDGTVDSGTIELVSSTSYTNMKQVLLNYFDPSLKNQPIFLNVDGNGDGYLVANKAGYNSRLQVSANIKVDKDTTDFFTFAALNASGNPLSDSVNVTASGTTLQTVSSAGATSLIYSKFSSLYPGAAYNLLTRRDGSIQGLSLEVNSLGLLDNIVVNSEGAQAEQFDVVLSPSSPQSLEYLLTSDPTNSQSDYIFASIVDENGDAYVVPDEISDKINTTPIALKYGNSTVTSGTPRFVKLVEGTYSFAGGDSGYSTTESGESSDYTALIGTDAAKSGIYALNDDSLNISIGIVPGIAAQSVQNALITLAETSKNFVAVVAPPYGLDTVQDAVNWVNGKTTRTAAINNSYAAVYWPWVQVFNYFAGADEWYDPAIFAARQMVYTDSVSEPWFAPAGYRRGRLTKPSAVEVILNQGDKDALYVNNINPISNEPLQGITIFGQKTAQRNPTALDRVNVRRLMIYVRKVLLALGKPFQFEPNDEFTWTEVEAAIAPFLDDLKARRAIVEGDVICNAATNTPLRVDRNELWCSISIKPTKAAETIVFEVNLTNQSATING